jgi:hypothetical protein
MARKTPCKKAVITAPVAGAIPSININISFSGSTLEEVHKNIIEYLKKNEVIETKAVTTEVVTTTELNNEVINELNNEVINELNNEVINELKNEVNNEVIEVIEVNNEVIEVIEVNNEVIEVNNEVNNEVIEVKDEVVNEFENKINIEFDKDKILAEMKIEYMTEYRKINKIRTDVLRVEKTKELLHKYNTNVKKVKKAKKLPNKIPTVITIIQDIVIDDVELCVNYAKKLRKEIDDNIDKADKFANNEEANKGTIDIIQETKSKRKELFNIKKALKNKGVQLKLPVKRCL